MKSPHYFPRFLSLAAASLLSLAAARGATVTNIIGDNTFTPGSTTISTGDTVRWINQGFSTHNVVSLTNAFASTNLPRNSTFSHQFNVAGTFSYFCSIHSSSQNGSVVVQAANQPPTVSFFSPTPGTKVRAGSSATLQANATDPDAGGSVARVDFFASERIGELGNSLGSATGAPFNFLVLSIPAGSFYLTAVATDNLGATNASTAIRLFSLTNTFLLPTPLSGGAALTISNSFVDQEYFVDALTNFVGTLATNWFAIATNTAPSNHFIFTDGVLTNPIPRLYRVRQSL